MKLSGKYFIFEAQKQSYKTLPQLTYGDCAVLKEIESPDGMKVDTELWQVKTLCLLFILSGLFVFIAKYTSCIKGGLEQVNFTFTNKRCGATSSPQPKRYTATETTARLWLKGLSSYFLSIGGKGVNLFSSLNQLPHSGRRSPLNSLI